VTAFAAFAAFAAVDHDVDGEQVCACAGIAEVPGWLRDCCLGLVWQ
jgi:hypothetical protein